MYSCSAVACNIVTSLSNKCRNVTYAGTSVRGDHGSTVVSVMCYKSEGRWFDPSWCQWTFSLTKSFRSHYGPGVDSASNRNEYQEHFLG